MEWKQRVKYVVLAVLFCVVVSFGYFRRSPQEAPTVLYVAAVVLAVAALALELDERRRR